VSRKPPTLADLIDNSRHLLYEIQMFGHTNRILMDGKLDPCSQFARADEAFDTKVQTFALIESHLTHARSLMRFLYPTPGVRDTDMFARDYLRAGTELPETWPESEDDLDKIDKEISHLTYLRPPAPTQWDISNKLTPPLLMFVWSVPEHHVQEEFKRRALAALLDSTTSLKLLASVLSGRVSVRVATQPLQ
jgi:hypothetical protein